MKQNTKNPGVSFIIAILISTILISIGLTVFESVSEVQQQSFDLEANQQLFYANEELFEKALLYHNQNGAGTSHTEPTGAGSWTLTGRKKDTITGILKEGQQIEIPFYYGLTEIKKNFTLEFSKTDFDTNNEIIPDIGASASDFNFPGSTDNNVLINWAAKRVNSSGIIETFIPYSNLGDYKFCGTTFNTNPNYTDPNGTSQFCEGDLNASNGNIIDSRKNIQGRILPGEEAKTLNDFWAANNPNVTKRKIVFKPFPRFINQTSNPQTTIKGIPWKISVSNTDIPTPTFTITTSASTKNNKYKQSRTTTLNEATSIGVLDNFQAQ